MDRSKYYSYKVYSLRCPLEGRIKYIGLTKRYLKERLWRHLNPDKPDNSKKGKWLRHLKSKGLSPEIDLIVDLGHKDKAKAEKEERFYISKYSHLSLLNSNEGGNKPPYMAGWNRMEFPSSFYSELGSMSDQRIASKYGTNKRTVARHRNNLGIKSYAQRTGNDGRFKSTKGG